MAEEYVPELFVFPVLICALILNRHISAKSVNSFFILNFFLVKIVKIEGVFQNIMNVLLKVLKFYIYRKKL